MAVVPCAEALIPHSEHGRRNKSLEIIATLARVSMSVILDSRDQIGPCLFILAEYYHKVGN